MIDPERPAATPAGEVAAMSALSRAFRGRWSGLALAVLTGGIAGLGHVPFAFAPAILAGLAGALVLLSVCAGWKDAARLGWAVGLGYFLVTLHWIVEPFLVDVGRHGWMAPLALIFMTGGLALFWSAAFGAAAALARGSLRPVAVAVTLPVAEWLRGTILSGFPWALPAYAWSETPLIHAAAVVGPHGLNVATVLAAAGIALALRRERSPLTGAALALPLVAVGAAGWWQSDAPAMTQGEAPIVRLVQPNAPQDEKWRPDRAQAFVDRQIALTATAPRPDLVVWPESAIPWRLADAGPVLEQAAEAAGTPLILGVNRYDGLRAYNSLVLLNAEGEIAGIYDKHHLVPFGEYIPFGSLARWLGLRSFAARDGYGFSSGPGPELLDLAGLGKVLPLICYEAIFPAIPGAVDRPDWMLQITNDAWFGTFSGPYQHLAQARFRAVEQGLPLVRVANTGVSAVIDARGRTVAALPLGQASFVDAALPPPAPPTLYARTGDAPVLAALLLGAFGLGALRYRR